MQLDIFLSMVVLIACVVFFAMDIKKRLTDIHTTLEEIKNASGAKG